MTLPRSRAAILAGAVLLAGCADLGRLPGLSSFSVVGEENRAAQWRTIGEGDLIVDLGPGLKEQMLEATQRLTDGTTEQRVVFSNDTMAAGENRLDVRLSAEPEPTSVRFSDQTLPGKLKEAFPDLTPGAVPQESTNSYGIFNYMTATGVGGPTCILAWQRLVDDSLPDGMSAATLALRFCRQEATVDQLLTLMQGWRWRFGTRVAGGTDDRSTLDAILDGL